jgi:predicted GTPase
VARYPGGLPSRSLGTLNEVFTVKVVAADTSSPEDERAQYTACRLLFDTWYRAAYLAAKDTLQVQDVRWLTAMKDRRYGTALRALCTIQAMIPDAPLMDAANQDEKLRAQIATGYSDAETETDLFEAEG